MKFKITMDMIRALLYIHTRHFRGLKEEEKKWGEG